MAQPRAELIDFSDTIMVSEKRVAILAILHARGELTYWGMRSGCYLVVFTERPSQLEALTGAAVDRLEFDRFVQLVCRAA
jgi:hypothetical protein